MKKLNCINWVKISGWYAEKLKTVNDPYTKAVKHTEICIGSLCFWLAHGLLSDMLKVTDILMYKTIVFTEMAQKWRHSHTSHPQHRVSQHCGAQEEYWLQPQLKSLKSHKLPQNGQILLQWNAIVKVKLRPFMFQQLFESFGAHLFLCELWDFFLSTCGVKLLFDKTQKEMQKKSIQQWSC